jgi:O-antigen/teichoic acid export membrane protein
MGMMGRTTMEGAGSAAIDDAPFGSLPAGLERLRAVPGVALALGDQALASGANFLFVIAIARAIDLHSFGLFSLGFAVVLFCSSLINALVTMPVSVLLPERRGADLRSYIAGLERLNRLVALGLLLLAIPVGLVAGHWDLVLVTAVAVGSRAAVECHRRVAYATHDGLRALMIDLVANLPLLLVAMALFIVPQAMTHAWEAMAVLAGCSTLGWLAGVILHARAIIGMLRAPLRPLARAHWSYGCWALGGALALWGSSQLYPFLIAGALGLREVALFNGCMRLMGVSNVVMQGIESYATPRLRRTHLTGDHAAYLRCWAKLLLVGFLCLAPVTVVALAVPERLLALVLGPGFAGGGSILMIAALLQVATLVARMLSVGLHGLKEPRPGFWGQVACAVLTVSIGPLVVSWWGLHGAALAMLGNCLLVACVLAASFVWLMAKRVPASGPALGARA